MKIYILRHGQTSWNTLRKLQGQTDIPLNENGILLARKTGAGLRDVPFDRVYSSPLRRSLETARLAVEGRNLEIVIDRRLEEISFGTWEGREFLPPEDIVGEDGKKEKFYFISRPDQYAVPPEGESFEQIIARTGEFLRDLAAKAGREAPDANILVSTHGCASRALLFNICNKTDIRDYWGPGISANCAVSIASLQENGQWKLEKTDVVYY